MHVSMATLTKVVLYLYVIPRPLGPTLQGGADPGGLGFW